MAVSDYSTTASENTAISGIALSDSMLVNALDNAIRQLMADVKGFYNSSALTTGFTMTGQLVMDDGASASAPDLAWTGDLNTGFYQPAADVIGVSLGGTLAARFDATNANATTVQTRAFGDARYRLQSTDIAVTDLADGTDGELITWGADGTPTTVAAGTSGHVLTSNGAGAAPTFQAPAATGGMTLLGTISTSSGTTHTLGSLDLSGYKSIEFYLDGVDSASAVNVAIDGIVFTATSSIVYGYGKIELTGGSGFGIGSASGTFVSLVGLNTSYTTASTSITFTTSASATSGSIRVYGVN